MLIEQPRVRSGADAEPAGGLPAFLAVIHALKAEIEERSPEYFDRAALRCIGRPDGCITILEVNEVTDRIVSTAAEADCEPVNPAVPVRIDRLLDRIGATYGIGLLATTDTTELNEVDGVLQRRIDEAAARVFDPPLSEPFTSTRTPDWLDTALRTIRQRQDAALAEARAGAAGIFARLAARTIERPGGR